MKLYELKSFLRQHPSAATRIILPDGGEVPAHYHITEVGHVAKRFIDCGGTVHDTTETCLLQAWHSEADPHHRLDARTFAKILDLGAQVLPHDNLDVEVEYEDCAVTQYPIASAAVVDGRIDIRLEEKHTDCLARQKCGVDGCGPATKREAAAACC